MSELLKNENTFYSEISELQRQSRSAAYKTVNTIGKGFSEANLKNIRQFYVIFSDFDQFATHCVANLT